MLRSRLKDIIRSIQLKGRSDELERYQERKHSILVYCGMVWLVYRWYGTHAIFMIITKQKICQV